MTTVFAMTLLSSAQAAVLTVNSTSEAINPGGVCTLRGAVAAVNGGGNANGCVAAGDYGADDTIVFADELAGQTVQLTAAQGGQIAISRSLILKGPVVAAANPANRVTLKGGGSGSNFRLLDITNAASPLTVEDLNFVAGHVLTGTGFAGAGAAIRSDDSAVTVRRCRFEGNRANKYGGAIEGNFGNINVLHSEFSGNKGSSGGAIGTMGSITVAASIFNSNEATEDGGALWADDVIMVSNSTFIGNKALMGGAVWSFETLVGRHLTLVNNSAGLAGAAVYVSREALLANSLIVGDTKNIGSNARGRCSIFNQTASNIVGQYNLVANMLGGILTSDTSCGGSHPVSIGAARTIEAVVDTAPGNHGGHTRALTLPAGSPAVDRADPTGATSQMLDTSTFPVANWVDAIHDQRGGLRPAGGGRDLGAYEANASIPTPTPTPSPAPTWTSPVVVLPNGDIGIAYISGALGASGGVTPPTYTVTEGSLPPGLILSGNMIEGTPMMAGIYTFIVTEIDNDMQQLSSRTTYAIAVGDKTASTVAIPLLEPWALALLAVLLGVIGWIRKFA